MSKPDTITVDETSPDFHGLEWAVTLNGQPVTRVIVASRLGGYVTRLKEDQTKAFADGKHRAETLYGDVDYERIDNAEGAK